MCLYPGVFFSVLKINAQQGFMMEYYIHLIMMPGILAFGTNRFIKI